MQMVMHVYEVCPQAHTGVFGSLSPGLHPPRFLHIQSVSSVLASPTPKYISQPSPLHWSTSNLFTSHLDHCKDPASSSSYHQVNLHTAASMIFLNGKSDHITLQFKTPVIAIA